MNSTRALALTKWVDTNKFSNLTHNVSAKVKTIDSCTLETKMSNFYFEVVNVGFWISLLWNKRVAIVTLANKWTTIKAVKFFGDLNSLRI